MQLRPLRFVVCFALPACAVLAHVARAQGTDSTRRPPGATVSGTVRDSVARVPLAGAWVQLVAADGQGGGARAVVSDSTGRFAIDNVPDGRYLLGYFHPMLDSLGVEPALRDVLVQRGGAVRADLATPSPAQLRAAICGGRAGRDARSGGVLVGVVRDAHGRAPVAGATVTGEWLEISFLPGGLIDRRRPRLVVTTEQNGWFALCNVPSGGTMFLGASRGDVDTDLIELQVPAEGFLRRELFLGTSRTVFVGDTTTRTDTLALPPRRLLIGDGRLQGTVVTVVGDRPLPGAMLRISEGAVGRADERGAWTIGNAAAGTRTLEVRAVGFYPVRRPVDVIDGALPARVALSTFQAVLDTVKIMATRTEDRQLSGFAERSRTGLGRYLTAADLERRGVIETSDVFKNLPGVRMDADSTGEQRITMRSAFGGYCAPSFYVDGLHMFTLSADELDTIVRAKNVRAIEVYTDGTVPPQFQQALSGCGAIVIWTK